jgi:hypothetical protein
MTDSMIDEKTERNRRVQKRYDELMAAGKHGHYETMFRVVREGTECACAAMPVPVEVSDVEAGNIILNDMRDPDAAEAHRLLATLRAAGIKLVKGA